jgi:hypothetical protein
MLLSLRLIWLQGIATSQGKRGRKRAGQAPPRGAIPLADPFSGRGRRTWGERFSGLLQIGQGFCITLLPGQIQSAKSALIP